MDDPLSGYCDYLDKEMTIMGLLSAFAVLVAGLVLDRTAAADPEKQATLAQLWSDQREFLGVGSIAFLLAALCFYLQRSLLAYYIGQLRFSKTMARYEKPSAKELLEDADSWATWIQYQTGFVLLALGFTMYGFAFYASLLKDQSPWRLVTISCIVAGLVAVVNGAVKARYRYHDEPWYDFFHFRRPIRK
jgi:uncharacterized oligopeptide transporter (OPT) family protein